MKAQSAIWCIQLQNLDKILHVGQDICNCGDIINSDMDSEMHPISWNAIIMIQQWEFRREQNTEKAAWTTNNKGNIVKVINGVETHVTWTVFFAATIIQSNCPAYEQLDLLSPSL